MTFEEKMQINMCPEIRPFQVIAP